MTWTKKSSGGSTTTVVNNSASANGLASKKPIVSFIFDDTNITMYNTMNDWISRGVRFTTGFRQDFIGSAGGGLTFDMVKQLQDNGFEIAYHGMHHNYTGGKAQYISENDIPTYLSICESHGININGFIGPNGDYWEDLVFHTNFDTFKWARGAGASNGVANIKPSADYFKLIYDSNSFIDDLTSEAAVTTAKTAIDTLATRGTGILHLSQHLNATTAPFMLELVDYILSKGISIMTVSEAYEIYGAVYEFYDNTLLLDGGFSKRVSGNGGNSINAGMPHFILQKDGNVISNMGVKMIPPVYKGNILNGNTTADTFDVGVSIVQFGSGDNHANLPNIGTLYNFNLGKDTGEQFQLFKSYNNGGIWFRENDNTGVWKTSSFVNKLGIFRATPPATSTAAGYKGDFSADANYLYVCYADNTWIRIPKDTVTW